MIDKEREKLIMEIMCLGFLVNSRTKYCTFVDFSGHVDSLRVDIRQSKEDYETRILETEFYAKEAALYKEEEDNCFLKAKRDVLKELLEIGEIPYDGVKEVIDQISRYKF